MPKTLSAVGGPRRSSALGNPVLIERPLVLVLALIRPLLSIIEIGRLYESFPLIPARNSAPLASFSELLVAGICKVAFNFSPKASSSHKRSLSSLRSPRTMRPRRFSSSLVWIWLMLADVVCSRRTWTPAETSSFDSLWCHPLRL